MHRFTRIVEKKDIHRVKMNICFVYLFFWTTENSNIDDINWKLNYFVNLSQLFSLNTNNKGERAQQKCLRNFKTFVWFFFQAFWGKYDHSSINYSWKMIWYSLFGAFDETLKNNESKKKNLNCTKRALSEQGAFLITHCRFLI